MNREAGTPDSDLSVAEILRQVRRIQLVANRVVDDLFAGQYHSVFRGQGMEFDEVREYQPGDEIRTIDWNVTARAGVPYIKRFREERELTVQFLVDVSASGRFGSGSRARLDVVRELAAVLMFSALKNQDKVGLGLFGDDVHRYVPPRKGKAHVLRLLRELVTAPPVPRTTRLDVALDFLNRVQKRKAVVFVVSDFLAEGWERPFAVAARRHDLVAIRVHDRRERTMPNIGLVQLEDPETGERRTLDFGSKRVRDWYARSTTERDERLRQTFRKHGVDELPLDTMESRSTEALARFFRQRERRLRGHA